MFHKQKKNIYFTRNGGNQEKAKTTETFMKTFPLPSPLKQ